MKSNLNIISSINSVSGGSNVNNSNSVNVVNSVHYRYFIVRCYLHLWWCFLFIDLLFFLFAIQTLLILQSAGESIWFWSGAPVPWWTIVSPFAFSYLVILNIVHFDEDFKYSTQWLSVPSLLSSYAIQSWLWLLSFCLKCFLLPSHIWCFSMLSTLTKHFFFEYMYYNDSQFHRFSYEIHLRLLSLCLKC